MKKKMLIPLVCILVVCLSFGLSKSEKNKKDKAVSGETSKSEITSESEPSKEENTEKKKPKRKFKPDDKLIALTFDDGPYSPVTDRILDTLEQNDAVATFFVVGNRVNSYKSSVERASKLGCEIGSHTYSHKALTRTTPDIINNELSKTNDVIFNITGNNIKVMRPPEGAVNDDVRTFVEYPFVHWSVDSQDWKYREVNADYNNVMNNVFDGSVILMHDLYDASADAVARFVPELTAQGYKFVTISELAEARGVTLENGTSYYSFKPQVPETTSDTSISENYNTDY